MTIGTKILSSFFAVALIYVAFITFNSFTLSQVASNASDVLPLNEKQVELQRQLNLLLVLESDVESYIVIRSDDLKSRISSYFETESEGLSSAVAGSKVSDEVREALAALRANITELVSARDTRTGFEMTEKVLAVYDSIDTLKNLEIVVQEDTVARLKKLIEEQTRATERASRISWLMGLALFSVGTISSVLLARSITKPVIALRNAVVEFGKGNLDSRCAANSSDEVGDLARSFNEMAEDIQKGRIERTQNIRDLEATNKELSKVIAETQQMNKLMVARELKMIELKKQLRETEASSEKKRTVQRAVSS